jgi:hypothetical protein
MHHLRFAPLLQHLSSEPFGPRLAALSTQTKVEKFVLAELSYGGAMLPQYEFRLEGRPRRDLTVREQTPSGPGRLVEWLEAKMCYSDCVARPDSHRRRHEYLSLLRRDIAKQTHCKALSGIDCDATLTVALFVFHCEVSNPHHAYSARFRNRQSRTPQQVKRAAIDYCAGEIVPAIGRDVSEHFNVQLDAQTELMCFCYSAYPRR